MQGNPSGIDPPLLTNCWPSFSTPHAPMGSAGVTGGFSKTSDGCIRFRTVILTSCMGTKSPHPHGAVSLRMFGHARKKNFTVS